MRCRPSGPSFGGRHLSPTKLVNRNTILFTIGTVVVWLLVACQSGNEVQGTSAEITKVALTGNTICAGYFITHELDHTTTNAYEPIDMYDSNGSGLAINDLDNDGDLDIVLANLAGRNNIFWNEGNLNFRRDEMEHGSSRAVATVDVDADGWLDIVFTTRVGTPILWRNGGDGSFEKTPMPGVDEHAYSMVWADLDADGDIDLVTGSYDTSLEKELRDSFMFGNGAGVFIYTNQGDGTFESERLAEKSQALTIQLIDFNMDGRKDILVGNDFVTVRDYVWLASDAGWISAEPLSTTTENTMSFDMGDVNNDGSQELFAADMHPYSKELEADYMPMMENMMASHTPVEGDPQVMSNVLQMRDDSGAFVEKALKMGVGSTGWSWSTKFGDLDQDGYLDLYSVNGMASFESFGYLPNYTLVEENQVLRNNGNGNFDPVPQWQLGKTAGGRGMSMADFDNDGDLDILINNMLDKAVVLENQLCIGTGVQVDLRQPEMQNRFALGAVVTLETAIGDMTRDVRAASGYLSGDATRVHFGVPKDIEISGLTITWPDGETTKFSDIEANQLITVERLQ